MVSDVSCSPCLHFTRISFTGMYPIHPQLFFVSLDSSWTHSNLTGTHTCLGATKNNHNILQGVAEPGVRLTEQNRQIFEQWIEKNAHRYWFSEGGPLTVGGVDVAVIGMNLLMGSPTAQPISNPDDPQMPGLIPMIRKARPGLPIVYRSHIEIRSELVHVQGSPQNEVWSYLWDKIKLAGTTMSLFVTRTIML
jgi:alpha,alpha-trehalose phosphorylase (configuration-retaining)